jgi:hypothetical protein
VESLACATRPHEWSNRWHHKQKPLSEVKKMFAWLVALVMWEVEENLPMWLKRNCYKERGNHF